MDRLFTIQEAIQDGMDKIKQKAVEEGCKMAAFADLAMGWPDERSFKSIYYSSTRVLGTVHVTAQVDTRAEAVEWLEPFKLEPLIFIRGSFASIRPLPWIDEQDRIMRGNTIEEITDIWPVYWKFDDYWKAQLQSYATINGVKTNITVNIKNDPAFRSIERTRDTREYETKRIVRWTLHKAPGGTTIKFASGSPENAGNVYVYFPHEAGGAAPDVAEFLNRSQNIEWRGNR